tara:strand:+ start:1969 stop:2097 length:129 start_codon:yes stop_codon:yes gene_type:complete
MRDMYEFTRDAIIRLKLVKPQTQKTKIEIQKLQQKLNEQNIS